MKLKFNIVLKPYNLVILTFLLSFIAWLTPSYYNIRKGFEARERIFSIGFIMYLFWMVLIVLSSYIGYKIGNKKMKIKFLQKRNLLDDRIYNLFLLTTFLGIIAVFIKILASLGMSQIIFLVRNGYANQLKYVLYDDYSFGVLSLRYLVIHLATLAYVRRFIFKKKYIYDIFAFGGVLLVSLISSRLTLVMFLFQSLIMKIIIQPNKKYNIKIFKSICYISMLFLTLSLFSQSRNKNFYEARGNTFLAAGIGEVITYLGTPFQGGVVLGNKYEIISQAPREWQTYATIERSLTTNSSFLQLFREYGFYNYVYICTLIFIFSILLSLLKKNIYNISILSYTTIMYGFFELWRLYWFNTGIFIILFISPLFFSYVAFIQNRRKSL